ncbi:MAG: pyridoxamine 5'-phosphate oxidase family protein [Flavisolibacter sp.]
MLGTLQPTEIEELLRSGMVGRIGCHADGETYVVPISYAYDGQYIYCHTQEGKKAHMMRKNPKVCFQVEVMKDMANWKSVIVQGRFEELTGKADRDIAMQALVNRYLPVISSVTTHLGKDWPFHSGNLSEIRGLVFRIAADEKTGRFESGTQSPDIPG